MKHLKAKLLSSVVMVLIAAVLLSSSAFAWYTLSTNPEVANISTSVGANGNLEIALLSAEDATEVEDSAEGDAGKNVAWGNLVDLTAFEFEELKPCLFEDGVISIPTFGLDGRIVSVDALDATWKTGTGSGNFTDGGIFEYVDAAGNVFAYRVDFFMRSNVAGTVSLGAAADRGAGDSSGAGSTITEDSNITIAFYQGATELLTLDADATAGGTLEGEVIELTENTPELISMYIFVDGETLTNAELLTEDLDVDINIQFTHSETLDPLDIQGADYDKP